MRRMHAVFPIVAAFLCGYHVPDLAWAIDTGAGVHGATDLYVWIVVPTTGLFALHAAWRAFATATPPPTSGETTGTR